MTSRGYKKNGIRAELIAGFAIVVFTSSLITYLVILLWTRSSFDDLVKANDVELATEYARSLSGFYQDNGSWDGVVTFLKDPGNSIVPMDRDQDHPDDHHHPKNGEIPLVVTDSSGEIVFSGLEDLETREGNLSGKLKLSQGEKVSIDGTVVGYVYFKSMIFRSYNPQEQEFLVSLAKSMGLSVLIGLFLSLILGSVLAARFAGPIIALNTAVKRIAEGERNTRVQVSRKDEIGSLAESFNQMTERLQVTEEARQNLLADIAHELRTPVSILQANLEMILEGVYAADEPKLKSLHKETVLLTSLIKDLRSMSDLEVGTAEMKKELFQLSPFIEETCRKYMPLFDEKGIRLDLFLDEEVAVMADEDKIRQVLGNLLGNALKYAPGSSAVKVSVQLDEEKTSGRNIRVTVADEGPGVPEESLKKIFDRFYRVDQSRSRKSGGRGLGLSISRKIIEISGGSMGASNNSPHGLSVWFSLPFKVN